MFRHKLILTTAILAVLVFVSSTPTPLNAQVHKDFDEESRYGWLLGFVYGTAAATAHYEWPMATGMHSAYINNYSGGLPDWPDKLKGLRFYVDFESRIYGKNYNKSDDWHHRGWLDSYWSKDPNDRPGYWWKDKNFDFDLTNERKGRFTLESYSILTAKYDIDGDGLREIEVWGANAKFENFMHERPNLGVE